MVIKLNSTEKKLRIKIHYIDLKKLKKKVSKIRVGPKLTGLSC
jgi:hypothetical protein